MLSLLAVSLLAAPSPVDLATASPDAPALELGWRDGMRAKGGGRIRLLGDGEDRQGGFFEFQGFIELHNGPGYHGVIPYEYWRGRFALEGGHRWKFDGPTPWVLRLTGALEHESDHSTSPNVGGGQPDVGFVNLNSLSLQAGVRRGGSSPSHAALTARLHVVTCTRSQTTCGRGGGLSGDRWRCGWARSPTAARTRSQSSSRRWPAPTSATSASRTPCSSGPASPGRRTRSCRSRRRPARSRPRGRRPGSAPASRSRLPSWR
ncbi:MAG: hypothetical protein H6Q89_1949 [Myxococcaceae bacterium]|nr:hypothetical protein [Myxococcaceae bacterium]